MSGKARLRRFDLGNKAVDSSVFDNSVLGAMVTIASIALMTVLFLSELMLFIRVDTSSHMAIADFHEHDAVSVRLHVTFPHVECKDLEVIAENARGIAGNVGSVSVDHRPASAVDTRQFKGKGAEGAGCTLDGTIEVARAGGSIHVHVMHHDPSRLVVMGGFLSTAKGEQRDGPNGVPGANVTHKIHDFGFGPAVKYGFAESRNPLAGNVFVSDEGAGQVRYSLKVVPISHQRIYGHEMKTHTYSSNVGFVSEGEVMRGTSSTRQWLGVDFEYDFTPVMVRYTETSKSYFEFVTSVCAIVGGVHTVSGLLVQGLQGLTRKKFD